MRTKNEITPDACKCWDKFSEFDNFIPGDICDEYMDDPENPGACKECGHASECHYDIKPKIVDGEPVCDSKCYHSKSKRGGPPCAECFLVDYENGDPCIPALRQQRDELRATAARFMKEAEKYKRERDEALAESRPGVEQQLRLELAGTRIRANAALVAAHSLIGIAQHMATGNVSEEQQKNAQETLAKVGEQLKKLTEVKA